MFYILDTNVSGEIDPTDPLEYKLLGKDKWWPIRNASLGAREGNFLKNVCLIWQTKMKYIFNCYIRFIAEVSQLFNNVSGNVEATDNIELKEVMESSKILELYGKFYKAVISAAIVWDLEDDILDEDIKLTRIEKKKYKAAQKQQKSLNDALA